MKKSNYTIRLNEVEKKDWVEYAKKNYNNNMARMIRVAVHQLKYGTPDTNLDQQQINNSVEKAIDQSKLNRTLDRVEDQLDTINQKLSSVDPTVLEILTLISDGYTEEKQKTKKRSLKHDF